MPTIKASEFVKRQTRLSPYAYFTGSWEQLEAMVKANFDKAKQGYKPGVLLVPLNSEGFYSSIIKLDSLSPLFARYQQRREGEDFYVTVYACDGEKVPAKKVDIVVYSKEVLAEGNENSTDADFEIVSINASPLREQDAPMDPVTMMRNFLQRPGGTKGDFTAQQFAESIEFWSQHALLMGK